MATRNKKPPRGRVTVNLSSDLNYITLATLEEIIQQAKQRAQLENIGGICLEIETSTGWYGETDVSVVLRGTRPETDEEYEARTYIHKRQEELSLASKREMYERLKKELGE